MKIKPVKNYKKPNYASRLASVIAVAGVLTGCNTTRTAGETTVIDDGMVYSSVDTSEVQLAGDVSVEVELDGDIVVEEESVIDDCVESDENVFVNEEPELAGDIAVISDSDADNCENSAAGR